MQESDNTSSESYALTPEQSADWVIDAFMNHLARHISPDHLHAITTAGADRTANLAATCASLIADDHSYHHLRTAAFVLAAYHALQDTMPQPALLSLIRDAFTAPLREIVFGSTRSMLDASDDPFRAMVDVSKDREANYFGAAFTFERPQDDDRAYLVNISRCVWHAYFIAENSPELTPIFCAIDMNWIEAINPAQHSFTFVRPTTLGTGGPMCPFHFYRTGQKSS
jgi:hypothetical protein